MNYFKASVGIFHFFLGILKDLSDPGYEYPLKTLENLAVKVTSGKQVKT